MKEVDTYTWEFPLPLKTENQGHELQGEAGAQMPKMVWLLLP